MTRDFVFCGFVSRFVYLIYGRKNLLHYLFVGWFLLFTDACILEILLFPQKGLPKFFKSSIIRLLTTEIRNCFKVNLFCNSSWVTITDKSSYVEVHIIMLAGNT